MPDPWWGTEPHDKSDTKFDAAVDAVLARLPRAVAVGCCYLAALPAIGAPFGKTIVVALVVMFLGAVRMGQRVAEYGALILVAYALALWFGAVPAPATLRALAERAVALLGIGT